MFSFVLVWVGLGYFVLFCFVLNGMEWSPQMEWMEWMNEEEEEDDDDGRIWLFDLLVILSFGIRASSSILFPNYCKYIHGYMCILCIRNIQSMI